MAIMNYSLQKDYHKMLFPYAYNILGISQDAEDAVQDVMFNYFSNQGEDINNIKGYLVKSVINQSINIKNKRKKVTYDDVWLPEPIATEEADDNINLREIASYSLLILLEKLNPRERAVFILKEAFGYSHQEIADVLSSTVEQSRQLLSRGKSKLSSPKPKSKKSGSDITQEGILDKYIQAIRGRDTATLENLLSSDIAFFADGGENVQVAKKRSSGYAEVSELLFFVYHKFQASYKIYAAEINHQPALLYYDATHLRICQVFDLEQDGKIDSISSIVDPEKLKSISITEENNHHRKEL